MLIDSDLDDLARLRAGNGDQVFETLYRRHHTQVLATCQRITGNHHDAEEATQAVFLVLHDKARKTLMVDSLPAWLHRVACFVALRLRNTRRRRSRREARWDTSLEPAAPDTHYQGDLTCRLDEALNRLPAHYRLPLVLYYLEHCPCDEIASRLKLRSETIAVRISRARALLRRQLGVSDHVLTGIGLASLQLPPASGVAGAPLPTVSTTARNLAHQYQVSQGWSSTLTLLSTASAAAIAMTLVMACTSRHHDAQAASQSTPVVTTAAVPASSAAAESVPEASPPVPMAYSRASFPGPLWQERLISTLSRQVSLHCGEQPLWRLIDGIGRQSDLVMLASSDLSGFQAKVHPIALENISLQELLDHIAADAGLEYQLYAGGLLWQTSRCPLRARAVVPGVYPTPTIVQRWYRKVDLPPGRTLEDWVALVGNRPEFHFEQPHCSMEETRSVLVIGQRADAEAALEAVMHPAPIAMRPPPPPMTADFMPVLSAAEAVEQQAAAHPISQEPSATATLGELLAALASESGFVLQCASDAPELQKALPERPLPVRLRGLPLRFALCQLLEGTGMQAALHLPAAGADQRPVLLVGRDVAACFACHTYHFTVTPTSGYGALFDVEALVDWLRVNVDEPSWNDDRAKIETQQIGILHVTQSLEVLDDLDQMAPRLQTLEEEQPLPPRVPLLPPLTFTIAQTALPDVQGSALMGSIGWLAPSS